MSAQDNFNNGSLVTAGCRDLALVVATNPLVSRGLADLIQSRLPNNAAAYYHRGEAFARKEEYDRAIPEYDEATRLDPKFANAYASRARVWKEMREYDRAIQDFDETIRLAPNNAEWYFYRGWVHFKKCDCDRAIMDFNETLRIDPKFAPAYACRGRVWKEMKAYDDAVKDYEEAIRLYPNDATSSRFFAWLLASCPEDRLRDGKRSVQLATKACELTDWKSAMELDTLAVAYAEVGYFDAAICYETKALETPIGRGVRQDDFRQHLELFKQKKPYRQNT